ncbi:hypothetical protein BDB00DRAFT_827466 [Zychaea mexicana]|uniref:uncharacterized protein n=1 Tax=Zychaea mexicana TaxID=64656 RepID=UPI0022FE4AB5|nr:uncharacterized protein BDB00DRAFT_827466 [Zychaea mexicana]KAI9492638.1 hypothetical protein BDB00DRAFT_827466 [Zychaea mexicana]
MYSLQWLKDEHEYIPSRVMIDDSDTEYIAINKAYNYKNILSKLTAKPSDPSKTLKEKKDMREHALSLMMNMMKAEVPKDFDLSIDGEDEWESARLYLYFERELLPKPPSSHKYK